MKPSPLIGKALFVRDFEFQIFRIDLPSQHQFNQLLQVVVYVVELL